MAIPEGATTVEAEGRDLSKAIAGAAEELGLHPEQVDYKVDLSHFRSSTGVSVARTTVRIVAWESGRPAPSEDAAETKKEVKSKPKRDRERDRDRDRDEDNGERKKRKRKPRKDDADEDAEAAPDRSESEDGKPEQLRGAEEGSTEASDFAQAWFEKLLELMSVEGKVSGSGNEERVHLAIDAERAGRIVGKRGATLGAIRHLLGLALERKFGDLTVDVDVGDARGERKPRRERSRGRGERGRRDRGRDRAKGRYPEDKLRALARRGAEKAVETGKTYTINLELNAYDRRVVHLEISEIDGVDSQSEQREENGRTMKFVQIIPA
ncbi:MAG: KH domain-containing protein [Myxococcales bacterium]|nr:KH domain-containing protein [Myxococcales bacterium]